MDAGAVGAPIREAGVPLPDWWASRNLATENPRQVVPALQEALFNVALQGIEWAVLGDHSGGKAF
jgi:hypothetical protein